MRITKLSFFKRLNLLIAFILSIGLFTNCSKRSGLQNTTAPKNLPQPQFIPLPLGSIKPLGWLKTMALEAKEGYTGNMEKINKRVKEEKKLNLALHSTKPMPIHKWKNVKTKKTNWGSLEQDGYYIDGLVRLAYQMNDKDLIAKAKSQIDPVIEGQEEDGYFLHPKYKDFYTQADIIQGLENPKFTTKDDGEESKKTAKGTKYLRLLPSPTSRYLWSTAVFNRAVLALYDGSKEQKYLDFLVKFYSNFKSFKREVSENLPVSGTELHLSRHLVNIEVMFEVADKSGNLKIRQKALDLLKQNESGMVKTWLKKDFENSRVCHGVSYNELFKLYASSLDPSQPDYLKASENAFHFLEDEHMQPYGANSANEYLMGKGGFVSTELCDIVDMSWSVNWLIRATGKANYGDVIEKAFFNAFPASIDKYNNHAYLVSPNRLPGIASSQHRTEQHNFVAVWGPTCCTGNLNRALPNYVMHMAMKTSDNGLAVVTYGPNEVSTQIKGTNVVLTTKTDYPFKDLVKITITSDKTAKYPISFRIPQWCKQPSFNINGEKINIINKKGYVKIDREWKSGSVIEIKFPMEVKIHTDTEKIILDKTGAPQYMPPGGSRINSTGNVVDRSQFRYVTRGPLLYTLGFNNLGPNEVENQDPNYSYALPSTINNNDVVVEENDVKGWIWSFDKAPIKLKIKAQKINWKIKAGIGEMPVKSFKYDSNKSETITLVPFGCTKFRLTTFPILNQ